MEGKTAFLNTVSLSPKKASLVAIVSQPVGMGKMDREITYRFLFMESSRVFSRPIAQNLVTWPELAASEAKKYNL